MIGDILQPTHLLLILLVALLVLGPKRLPEVGRSLGKGLRDFRGAMAGIEEHTSNLLGQDEDSGDPEPSEATAQEHPTGAAQTQAPVVASVDPAPAVPAAAATSSNKPAAERRPVPEPDPSEYSD